MKKILMIVVVMMAALSSYAQEMYLGGGISLWRDCDADVTSFSISPDFGYNLNERWAVGTYSGAYPFTFRQLIRV